MGTRNNHCFREKMPIPLGRSPKAQNPNVSKSMKANKASGTGPELALRKALREKGLIGYRLNWKKAPGRPDICFTKKRIAIFVHGCFWHRCPYCKLDLPKTNNEFWKTKFERNVERDKLKKQRLKKDGWKVMTFWECQIKKNLPKVVDKIEKTLSETLI